MPARRERVERRDVEVGDVVRCRSTDYAEALGVGGQHGVVLEPRSAHCLVFFAGLDVSYWIPASGLRTTDAEGARRAAELRLLGRLLRLFEATEVEVETVSADRLGLAINHGSLSLETIEAIRDLLGPALDSLVITPGGMAFMTSQLAVRRDAGGRAE